MKRFSLKEWFVVVSVVAIMFFASASLYSCATVTGSPLSLGDIISSPPAEKDNPEKSAPVPKTDAALLPEKDSSSPESAAETVQPPAEKNPAKVNVEVEQSDIRKKMLERMIMSYFVTFDLAYKHHYQELTEGQIKIFEEKQRQVIREMLSLLDRYSNYHGPEEAEMIMNGGNFFGIGIEIAPPNLSLKAERYKNALKNAMPFLNDDDLRKPENSEMIKALARFLSAKNPEFASLFRELNDGIISGDGLEIKKIMPGAPAEAAGMKNYIAWRIVRVDGRDIKGLTFKEAINRIKGPAGTKVVLGLRSPDGSRVADVEIERGEVNSNRLESRMITPAVGYIKFDSFEIKDENGSFTADPVIRAIDDLKRRGAQKLIIDLRGNPGGLLHQALEILSSFLPANTLEVYTMSRGERNMEFRSSAFGQKYLYLPLVILVDEWSASASELVAISLKDHGRATIIGTKTYGKGTVQQLFPMPDGGILRLTIEKYFSPVGNVCVDEIGVMPDIEIKDNPETETDEVINKAIDIFTGK